MLKKKKLLIIIIVAIVLVAAATAATIYFIQSNNKQNTVKTPTKATADELKSQAIQAASSDDTAKAKTLLLEAQQQYKDINDTTNTVDTAAQLWMLEHPPAAPAGTTKPQ